MLQPARDRPYEPRTFDAEARARSRVGTGRQAAGNPLWVQISHAGRQTPRYVTSRPRAPSAVQLDLLGNYARPLALTETEIVGLIGRFAHAAQVVRDTGFSGVQVHGAHGYLISSFLSPVTNQRTDAWGGSLENRARFLFETLRAVRKAVGADFPVALKLNSDDFRKGGFTHAECLQVVAWLNDIGHRPARDFRRHLRATATDRFRRSHRGCNAGASKSTRAREAYFLEYAAAIRKVARMPMMVTGGFRSRAGMTAAIGGDRGSGDCDVVGLGRPLCWMPDFPQRLLRQELRQIGDLDYRLQLRRRGWLSPQGKTVMAKALNAFGAQSWYYCQLFQLAAGEPAQIERGVMSTLLEYLGAELRAAWATRRVYPRGRER